MTKSISILFLLFILYSFFGWCMEVIVTLIDEKKLINRGFLIGPLCPIYGIGVILIQFLLNRYLSDPIVLFVMAVFICSLLEYFTSYIMEKMFKARWWDYSHKKYNINGRVCLDNLAAFGALGLIVMYILNPFFLALFEQINIVILNIFTIIISIIFIIDIIISFKIISGFKNVAKSMKKDNTEEITKKVRELLLSRGGLYKRLILAFKNFQASEMLLRITDQLKESALEVIDKIDDTIDQFDKTGKINLKKIKNEKKNQKKKEKQKSRKKK